MPHTPANQRIRLSTLRRWVRDQQRFAMLTCYDAATAAWLWKAGLRTFLVGDTAAQFVLGHENTLPVSLDFMVTLTAAVRRGAPQAFVMADMPFGSYQCGDDAAIAHAMRFLTEGGADVVKMEVDESFAPLVKRLSSAGVPVVAHLGSRPQQRLAHGRYRTVYHSAADVQRTVAEARALVQNGAVMLLLEAVPAEVSRQVIAAVAAPGQPEESIIPVVGCGAGPDCHGHVVVLHDVLGLTDWHAPFSPVLGHVGQEIQQAVEKWVDLAESGRYLLDDHPYKVGE
ncbi:MAG: 3-methyl-2-oxobutanoate hydroxymethyltransferase [Phycisphaeraceae bacterium]|nr:3-methyl-2-oxobutanoate hydroxymethyltransferase [Phycisphaeraceae bacterium]